MTLDATAPVICSICARGGSKGVRSKNTRVIAGKPLFVHSLEQARASGLFDTVAVSSDDANLLSLAREHGADVLVERPAELATDTAGKLPAIQHCVFEAERRLGKTYGVMVDIDATSPLREPNDIVAAVELLRSTGAGNVITAAPSRRSPYFNMVEETPDGGVRLCKPLETAVLRRQDAPRVYDMNASIYVWRSDVFREGASIFRPDTRLYVMPEERSVDIDTETDWLVVEMLMSRRLAA